MTLLVIVYACLGSVTPFTPFVPPESEEEKVKKAAKKKRRTSSSVSGKSTDTESTSQCKVVI